MTHIQLTETEARMLTAKAVTTANALAHLLKQLHDGQAHKALGYTTWDAYVRAEFGHSPSWFYDALKTESIKAKLQGAGVLGAHNISNRAALALAKLGDDMVIAAYEVAAKAQKPVTEPAIMAAVETINQTILTGAVTDADGNQYRIDDVMADGVRGVLREDVLSKREYLAVNVEALFLHGYAPSDYTGQVVIYLKDVSFDVYERMLEKPVHISIWREE
jgi:hypothetical protein